MPIFKFSLNELVLTNDKRELRVEGINFDVGKTNCAVALIGESGMGALVPYNYQRIWLIF
ncbi:MAG: hypothetical protein D3917_20965 [Candidatus Electrothrix sp. AX5]|nr:hypothetical protein [Candidatus Electrothrix sp. AX5]